MKYIAIQYINCAKNYSAVLCFAIAFFLTVWNTCMLFSYGMTVSIYSVIQERSRSVLSYLLSVRSHFH